MNTLNLNHLNYFVDAVREGGISASARKNRVTQSAVSRAISTLESELGVAIVIHGKNSFQLTEAGEEVIAKSRAIFQSVADLKETAQRHLNILSGPLRFGCNQAIASRIVAPGLVRLAADHPEIKPVIKIGNTDQIQRMIDSAEIDFGIVVDDGEVGRHYSMGKLYSGALRLVKVPKLKFDLGASLLVSRSQKGGLSQLFLKAYESAFGDRIVPKLVLPSWQVILDLAIAGYGVALVPEFVCEEALLSKRLEIVPLKMKTVRFSLCTIVNKNRTLPRNAEALLKALDLDE